MLPRKSGSILNQYELWSEDSMDEEQNNWKEDDSVCDVKSILKTIYETQSKSKLPIFKGMFHETIPFVLYSRETTEPFFAFGCKAGSQSLFKTCFFRIEKVVDSCLHLSLLHPTDVEGSCFKNTGIPYRLKKTNSKVIVDLEIFCGIQCISPKLINRKVIISGEKC